MSRHGYWSRGTASGPKHALGFGGIAAVISSFLWFGLLAPAQAQQEPLEISGILIVNGFQAPAGIKLILVRADDNEVVCGEATTDDTGGFVFQVTAGCPEGEYFVVHLVELRMSSESEFMVDLPPGVAILVEFLGLTDEQLATLGVDAGKLTPFNPAPTNRFIGGWVVFLVLVILVGAGLVAMVAKTFANDRPVLGVVGLLLGGGGLVALGIVAVDVIVGGPLSDVGAGFIPDAVGYIILGVPAALVGLISVAIGAFSPKREGTERESTLNDEEKGG